MKLFTSAIKLVLLFIICQGCSLLAPEVEDISDLDSEINKILKGDKIELVSYKYPDKEIVIDKIINESGSEIDAANPTSFAFLDLGKEVDNYSILRKKGNDEV